MNVTTICSKALGIATAGLVIYDAHKNGLIHGTMNAKQNVSNTVVDAYIHSTKTSKLSTVEANAKKSWFRFVLDNHIKEPFDACCGYIGGVFNSVINDIVPTALAIGAIAGKRFGKLCGLGLAIYGAKYLLCDVMSIGKRDYLKEDI